MPDFFDLSYLKNGSPRQQAAFTALANGAVMKKLAAFDPVLVGTIPIGIDIATSDLDILCCFENLREFRDQVLACFAEMPRFSIQEIVFREERSVVANFFTGGFEVEMFAQKTPVRQQNAYRHLLVEHRILMERGPAFRQQVIALKQQGFKTEPAFAVLLGLQTDDAYAALLEL